MKKINLKMVMMVIIMVVMLVLIFYYTIYQRYYSLSKTANNNNKAEIMLFYNNDDSELVLLDYNKKNNNYQIVNQITIKRTNPYLKSYSYNKKHNSIITTLYKNDSFDCKCEGIILTDLNTLKSKRLKVGREALSGCNEVSTSGDYVVFSSQENVTLFDIKDNTQKNYSFPPSPKSIDISATINQDNKVFLFGEYNKEINGDLKSIGEIKMISNGKIKNVVDKYVLDNSYNFYKNDLYVISYISNDNGDIVENYITIIDNNGKVLEDVKMPFIADDLNVVANDKIYLTKSDRIGNNASIIIYDLKTKNFATTPIKLKDKAIWSLDVKNNKIYVDSGKNLDDGYVETIKKGYFKGLTEEHIYIYDAKTYKLLNTMDVNTKEYNPSAYMFSSFMVIDQK